MSDDLYNLINTELLALWTGENELHVLISSLGSPGLRPWCQGSPDFLLCFREIVGRVLPESRSKVLHSVWNRFRNSDPFFNPIPSRHCPSHSLIKHCDRTSQSSPQLRPGLSLDLCRFVVDNSQRHGTAASASRQLRPANLRDAGPHPPNSKTSFPRLRLVSRSKDQMRQWPSM